MVNDHVDRVRNALLPLCEPLHDALAWAEQLRRERLPELDGPPYLWFTTHTIRALTHYGLTRRADDLVPWELTGNHAQNGPLWMGDGSFRLRLLHALDEDVVPPPGTNRARRAYYANPPLGETMPLWGESNDRLLGLWRIDPESGAAVIRVVRPIGNWQWGTHQVADLDFILPDTTVELTDLEFIPTDEGLGLDLPMNDEEEGDGAGGVSG